MAKREHIVREGPTRLPVHPGFILKEDVLPNLELTVTEAAKELGVSRQTLHRIMRGTNPVTPDMALRLGRFCDTNPMIWLRLQQAYDLKKAELEIGEAIKKIPVHHAVFHHVV